HRRTWPRPGRPPVPMPTAGAIVARRPPNVHPPMPRAALPCSRGRFAGRAAPSPSPPGSAPPDSSRDSCSSPEAISSGSGSAGSPPRPPRRPSRLALAPAASLPSSSTMPTRSGNPGNPYDFGGTKFASACGLVETYVRLSPERVMATPLRILIAEDEALNALALRSQLEALGHRVVGPARNGREAVEIAAREPVDLAILDIRMPELTGLEAAERIVEKRPIPIILLTGFGEPEFA